MKRTKTIESKWVTAMMTTSLMTGKQNEPTVNWSGVGAVDIKTTREFANRLLEVCDKVESNEWD